MDVRSAEERDGREAERVMNDDRTLTILLGMIHEPQRLLIREANYLRALVGLPPVRAERQEGRLRAPTTRATGRPPP